MGLRTHEPSVIAGLLLGAVLALFPAVTLAQTYSGNVVPFTKDGVQGFYVFESSGARLYGRFVSATSIGVWEDHGRPSLRGGASLYGPLSAPRLLSYSNPVLFGSSEPRLQVFVVREGALYSRYWDGTGWSWRSYGAPPNASLVHEAPAVVTYVEDDGLTRRIVAYGRDTDGELQKMSHAGSATTWTFLGHPLQPNNPNTLVLATGVEAVTFREDGVQHTYVFAGVNLDLYLNYSNGISHDWFRQGGQTQQRASVISFDDSNIISTAVNRNIYAFVSGAALNGSFDLWVNYYQNGHAWQWADQNGPVDSVRGKPHAITFTHNGYRNIWVFIAVPSEEGSRLWVNVWDGFEWGWSSRSTPWGPQTSVKAAGAATDTFEGKRRLAAIARTDANGDLWLNWFSDGLWSWVNLGHP